MKSSDKESGEQQGYCSVLDYKLIRRLGCKNRNTPGGGGVNSHGLLVGKNSCYSAKQVKKER